MVKLNTKEKGRRAIWREYEQIAIDYLYEEGTPQGSGPVFHATLKELMIQEKSISRASIIFFLNRLRDQKLVEYTEGTGKGGHHGLYHAHLTREEFEARVMETILESALDALPTVDRGSFGSWVL
jgi:predicted transcriptional regulator